MFYLYDNVYHLGVYNPKNLGNDKTDKVVQFLVGGVYNPKNLGNDKTSPIVPWMMKMVFITPKI